MRASIARLPASHRQAASGYQKPLFDQVLLSVAFLLQVLGLVMVASSSVPVAQNLGVHSLYFVFKHSAFLLLGWLFAYLALFVSMETWRKGGPYLLLLGMFLLLMVLLVGHEVNGSRRWLRLGPFSFQVSECVKLFFILYLSGYLVRRKDELQNELKGFIKPLLVVSLITGLVLLEPDFGAATVIMAICLAMMFLAGARLWQFIVLTLGVVLALAIVAMTQEYRLKRLQSFLDPWQDPFGSGYQLTQSLIAFARGDWFGQGLGNSIQKLSYLPEAHTDFVFAILAEELGFIGVVTVILLFVVLFIRAMEIGKHALQVGQHFAAYTAFGLGVWLALQSIINIGVNSGVLPTKGLTLPLMSYGGTSLILSSVAIAILLRIDFESHQVRVSNEGKAHDH